MKKEVDIDEIRGRFGNGICCAMSVFGDLAPMLGLDAETARSIASGFCGHYEHNNFCGCVSGAKMALGMKYGPRKLGDNDKAVVLKQKIREFEEQFATEFGSTHCPEILGGLDPSVQEDRPKIIELDLFHTTCVNAVCFAEELLQDMLEDEEGELFPRRRPGI